MNTETDSDAGSRGYQGLWKASPSRQRRRDKRAAERAAVAASDAVKATSTKKVTAEKASVDESTTAEKAVLEKTANQKSDVAKISETEEVAITSTKHAQCAQTRDADVVSKQRKKTATKLCPYCSSSYKGVVSYSERCLCMDMGQAGCDCTCACDTEQMALKTVCFPTARWWTVQSLEERQRLLSKAAICINAYYKYEED